MLSNTAARVRGRTRRALLAAALPAVLAAVALPAAADAATVDSIPSSPGIVNYNADPGEVNNLRVSLTAAGIVFDDQVPIRSLDTGQFECRINSAGDAVCPAGVDASVGVFTGDRNDAIQYTAPHGAFVVAGDGADTIFGGLREATFGRPIQPVMYRGKDSVIRGETPDSARDTVSYRFAGSRVVVDLADQGDAARFDDGRPGVDREQIEADIEIVEGSNFADVLFGSDANDTIIGVNGDDEIGGGDGNDTIDEGASPNGADSINGGGGIDRVTYGARTGGVMVRLDGVRNDGADNGNERDDVRPNVEQIVGSRAGDFLFGNGTANKIFGGPGDDTLVGGTNGDFLSGGSGLDRLFGEAGNDILEAKDGQIDSVVDCGTDNDDTANRDSFDQLVTGCESGTVGVLRLTPATVRAEAGNVARMRLSWRHPDGWRKLRTIELRLLSADGVPVGEITIRPRAQRITADGAVRLVRKASRLTRKGKTVTARLAVRLDDSVAGQKLGVEVEATDTRGRRQLERDAGSVRVAR
jgi:hypothetical protein